MIGAIIGDIVGSRFEFNNCRNKDFVLFSEECFPTDDSIMTLAIGKALLDCKSDYDQLGKKAIYWMQKIGRKYPDCGFGARFYDWIFSKHPKPYGSYGNGSAMRVSAVGVVAQTFHEVRFLSKEVTKVSHNHPEGIKGAEATSMAIFMAKLGSTKQEIREYIEKNYYPLDFTLEDIRSSYEFNVTCQNSVPQALEAFFESNDFEEAIRNAISIGGDSDTLAAICGSVAETYYGVPLWMHKKAIQFLDSSLQELLFEWEEAFPTHILK